METRAAKKQPKGRAAPDGERLKGGGKDLKEIEERAKTDPEAKRGRDLKEILKRAEKCLNKVEERIKAISEEESEVRN